MVSKLPKWVWAGGAVLAFSAGMINAIAIMGFVHQAATHVTGTFSLFSIALFGGNRREIAQTFCILLSFFTGAVISGFIIRDGQLRLGRRYGFALAVECALLLLATWGFVRDSVWGEFMASMAAGLQNAMASTYSGTIIRTTHMTGILTDIGALTGNKLRGVEVDDKRLSLLIILVSSFVCGGFGGSWAYRALGPHGMLIPAAAIGACALIYEMIRRRAVTAKMVNE